jgi:hypothetical protein
MDNLHCSVFYIALTAMVYIINFYDIPPSKYLKRPSLFHLNFFFYKFYNTNALYGSNKTGAIFHKSTMLEAILLQL